jgi:hypothetical protein
MAFPHLKQFTPGSDTIRFPGTPQDYICNPFTARLRNSRSDYTGR